MYLSAVIAEQSVTAFLQHGTIEHLFRPNEIEAFKFVREFVKQYAKLPSTDTLEAHTGEVLNAHTEPAEYYLDLMQARHIELTCKQAMKKASDLLLPENKDPEAALKTLTEAVMQLATQHYQKQIVDFRDAYDVIVPEYVQQYNAEIGNRLMLGWPSFDQMSGGIVRGDKVGMVGRPAAGKTWQMLYAAVHGWRAANEAFLASEGKKPELLEGASRLFVSMEMAKLPIEQRLAAMQAKVPMSQLKHADLTTAGLKKLKKGLTEIKGYGAPFWIVDMNLAGFVEDIWMLARQLKPDAIFIDGAYLLKHPTERDRFRRVAENADLIKSELCSLVPTVCSWQFAKTASKKKKGEKVTGDDIGYSDAIYQASSIVLGLFEEESVETIKQRRIEVLKGRGGEVGQFRTNWDFNAMDFSEVVEEAVQELQFV